MPAQRRIQEALDAKFAEVLESVPDMTALDPRLIAEIAKRVKHIEDAGLAIPKSRQESLLDRARARAADLRLSDDNPNDQYQQTA